MAIFLKSQPRLPGVDRQYIDGCQQCGHHILAGHWYCQVFDMTERCGETYDYEYRVNTEVITRWIQRGQSDPDNPVWWTSTSQAAAIRYPMSTTPLAIASLHGCAGQRRQSV